MIPRISRIGMELKSGYQPGMAWIRECRWIIAGKAGKSITGSGLVLSLAVKETESMK